VSRQVFANVAEQIAGQSVGQNNSQRLLDRSICSMDSIVATRRRSFYQPTVRWNPQLESCDRYAVREWQRF